MSFWDLSDGESAVTNEREYEQPTGNLQPIPDGSTVLAIIDEAKWDETREERAEFVSLRWSVLEPVDYANRKIYQKLWVTDDDPRTSDAVKMGKKRDKAKKMLAAVDANSGGKLARNARKPTDDDLTLALTNKPMAIKCMVWELDSGQIGNWIAGVFPKSKGVNVTDAPPPAKQPAKTRQEAQSRGALSDLEDDVPF
jgi:hypothetical protein